MDTTTVPVSNEILAHDLRNAFDGKMEQEKLDSAVAGIAASTTAYPANGSIVSLIFYLQFQVTITSPGGKQFNGKAGGVSTPGGGFIAGHVYTDNLSALYSKTVSFAFTATPVYTALYFFDKDSNYLGSFQAGAVSIVSGTGGGSGSWS